MNQGRAWLMLYETPKLDCMKRIWFRLSEAWKWNLRIIVPSWQWHLERFIAVKLLVILCCADGQQVNVVSLFQRNKLSTLLWKNKTKQFLYAQKKLDKLSLILTGVMVSFRFWWLESFKKKNLKDENPVCVCRVKPVRCVLRILRKKLRLGFGGFVGRWSSRLAANHKNVSAGGTFAAPGSLWLRLSCKQAKSERLTAEVGAA